MSSGFLRELVAYMRENGETETHLDVAGQREPVVIEYVPLPDSERVHGQMRLLDASNAQQPHSHN